ncbi:LysR family transcriptional regulator [Luteimonas aestuarii]|uniref:LysR family transcriptional regulator n=1 Tax=Luteimonas aestuarii TaxID=453837 RepID=A0A4R5TR58_9GAMM|nr:LysR substrate-binding domain-containing protein [Luteimonas aestuarii]TDK23292.1 LysR family transcriptional regulator [Luteimonas aestuarii]
MLRISLDALQVLDAIDRRGSFSGAAKELFRVPSTISYTVSTLEDALGVQLFERMGPRVALTAAGHELLREGRHLLKAAGDLEQRVRRVASGWETEFGIGLDSSFPPIALHEDIAAFHALAQGTRLRIVHEALSGAWEALLDERIDIVLAAGEGPGGGGYVSEVIGTIDFVFAVAPAHPLASIDRPLGKADLQPHRAVAVADSARRLPPRTVGLLFGQDTLTVPDMHSKLQFQLAGAGFGFLPDVLARPAIATGRLVGKQVEEPRAPETFHVAWRSDESGAALDWWRARFRDAAVRARLMAAICGG